MNDLELQSKILAGHKPTIAQAERMLKLLRWDADMAIVNDFGEHVWLGPCLDDEGKRIGITDCCLVAEPCERHAKL